jgi:hypothetical protein
MTSPTTALLLGRCSHIWDESLNTIAREPPCTRATHGAAALCVACTGQHGFSVATSAVLPTSPDPIMTKSGQRRKMQCRLLSLFDGYNSPRCLGASSSPSVDAFRMTTLASGAISPQGATAALGDARRCNYLLSLITRIRLLNIISVKTSDGT